MPQIIVTTGHDDETTVMLRERISVSDFESERFAANLVERLGWAVVDATDAEREDHVTHPTEPEDRPRRSRPITGERRRAERRQQNLEPVGSA